MLFLCWFVAIVLALVSLPLSFIALNKINNGQATPAGKGQALAGVICSGIALVLSVGFWLLIAASWPPRSPIAWLATTPCCNPPGTVFLALVAAAAAAQLALLLASSGATLPGEAQRWPRATTWLRSRWLPAVMMTILLARWVLTALTGGLAADRPACSAQRSGAVVGSSGLGRNV